MRAGAFGLPVVIPALVVLVSLCGTAAPAETHYSIPIEATQPAAAYTEQDANWRLYFPPDSRTLHLRVHVGNPDCFPLEHIEVTDGPDTVTLIAVAAIKTGAVCTSEQRSVQVDVSLNAPLGHRKLLGCVPPSDAATNCTVSDSNY